MASEINIGKLWEQYKTEKSIEIKHRLIPNYIWLVKFALQQMSLPSNTILEDGDFLNIGILGLHESIERFELDRGVKFESFAIPRIKGIIQDELRKLDWLSRTARKKVSDFVQAGDSLRSSTGREVSSEEIMNKLNVTPDKYNTYLAAAAAAKATFAINETSNTFDSDPIDIWEEISDPSQVSVLERMENEERTGFIVKYLKQ